MPSIFNTWGFSTNAALSKKNYFNEDCLEFRLLATQMCDDLEMAEYVRTENYRFKKYWLLAKKEELKAKLDEMKENLSKFTFLPNFKTEKSSGKTFFVVVFCQLWLSDNEESQKASREESFVNPNLLDIDRKYKKKYEERLKNKLGLEADNDEK